MRFKEWVESYGGYNSNNCIVVDIQPYYESYIGFDIGEFCNFLIEILSKNKRVLYFYNGEDLGIDNNPQGICSWLLENNHSDDYDILSRQLNKITFYDKGYAFFRNWMDSGISDNDIIKAIRFMYLNRLSTSEQFPQEFFDENGIETEEAIWVPDISLSQLKSFNGSFLCGGGRMECLKEVQLLLN